MVLPQIPHLNYGNNAKTMVNIHKCWSTQHTNTKTKCIQTSGYNNLNVPYCFIREEWLRSEMWWWFPYPQRCCMPEVSDNRLFHLMSLKGLKSHRTKWHFRATFKCLLNSKQSAAKKHTNDFRNGLRWTIFPDWQQEKREPCWAAVCLCVRVCVCVYSHLPGNLSF